MGDRAPFRTPSDRTGYMSINRAGTGPPGTSTSHATMSDLRTTGHSTREWPDADALERHRLNSNAFAQQERRNQISANMNHPAFRRQQDDTPSLGSDPRLSQVTTFSRFINAGLSPQQIEQLQLVPETEDSAIPTARGIIEDRREHMNWHASGQLDDRTPVYIYSPKPSHEPLDSKSSDSSNASAPSRSKSPKKTFLDRFTFSRTKSSNKDKDFTQPLTPTEDIAPKAAAVLGTSMSAKKHNATTPSSSLTKRAAGMPDVVEHGSLSNHSRADPASSSSRLGHPTHITPLPTLGSGPADINTGRRIFSQPDGSPEQAATKAAVTAALARSQSLHYYDKKAPPTPPVKDTPPELKAKRLSADANAGGNNPSQGDSARASASSATPRTPHHQRAHTIGIHGTPSKPPNPAYGQSRPAQSHNSGYPNHNHKARVVDSEPSTESLRAVVITEHGQQLTDEEDLSDVEKADPFSPPSYVLRQIYSPSVYNDDFETGFVAGARAAGIDVAGQGRRNKHNRYSSPVVKTTPTFDLSPTRSSQISRGTNKNVTFEPRHTSHHYDRSHPYHRRTASADSLATPAPKGKALHYTTPTNTKVALSPPSAPVFEPKVLTGVNPTITPAAAAAIVAAVQASTRDSSSGSSSLDFLSTLRDRERNRELSTTSNLRDHNIPTNAVPAATTAAAAAIPQHATSSGLSTTSTSKDDEPYPGAGDIIKDEDFRKLSRLFERKPDFAPATGAPLNTKSSGQSSSFGEQSFGSMSPYANVSAMPSPLLLGLGHSRGEGGGERDEGGERKADGEEEEELTITEGRFKEEGGVVGLGLRVQISSTLGAGEGKGSPSDLSLRDRFLAEDEASRKRLQECERKMEGYARVTEEGARKTEECARRTEECVRRTEDTSELVGGLVEENVRHKREVEDIQKIVGGLGEKMLSIAETYSCAVPTLDRFEEQMRAKEQATDGALDSLITHAMNLDKRFLGLDKTVTALTEEMDMLAGKGDRNDEEVRKIQPLVKKYEKMEETAGRMALSILEAQSLLGRLDKLEDKLTDNANLHNRLTALEDKVGLGNRLTATEQGVSLEDRLAALEQKIDYQSSTQIDPGAGLRVCFDAVATPPSSAGGSTGAESGMVGNGNGGGSWMKLNSPSRHR